MYSFIDVETTGFDSHRNCVITLSSFVTDADYKILGEYDGKFRPDGERSIVWGDKAEEIHKISWDEAMTFPEVHESASEYIRFQREFGKTLFVAHNAPYDFRMIKGLFLKTDNYHAHYELFSGRQDTVQMVKKSGLVSSKSKSLGAICKELGIAHTHHDATSDAKVLIEIHRRCTQALGNNDLVTYVPEEAQGETHDSSVH